MASNQTSFYQLNQWEPEDKVLREEFNADNSRVDGALHSLAEEVGARALQTEVDGLKTQLATKAAQSALDSLSASVTAGLAKKYGTDNAYIKAGNYTGDGLPRTLLLEYCRYGRDSALDVFENNYRPLLLAMQHERKVKAFELENAAPAQG